MCTSPVTSLAFQPGGNRLAVGVGSTVQLWNLGHERLEPGRRAADAGTQVSKCRLQPRRSSRWWSPRAGTVQLWDLGVSDPATSVANPLHPPRTIEGPVDTASPSALTASRFASSSQDGTARVWLSLNTLVDLGCNTVGRNLTHEEWRELLPPATKTYQKTCEQWPAAE